MAGHCKRLSVKAQSCPKQEIEAMDTKQKNREVIEALLTEVAALCRQAIDEGKEGSCPFRLIQDAAEFMRLNQAMGEALIEILKQASEQASAASQGDDLAKRRKVTSH
jgi:predicted methyltransferase MtxX (methanogen marker protein 4)